MKNLRKQFKRVHKVHWRLIWNLKENFFRTWEVVENKIFEEKGNLSSEKKNWPFLTRIIVYDEPQGIIYKGPQAFLTNAV